MDSACKIDLVVDITVMAVNTIINPMGIINRTIATAKMRRLVVAVVIAYKASFGRAAGRVVE